MVIIDLKAHVDPSGYVHYCAFILELFICWNYTVYWLAVISQVEIFNYARSLQCIQGDNGP